MIIKTKLFMAAALLLCGLTMQAQEPYAVLSEDNTVLTFYYDNNKTERSGMSVGPFVSAEDQNWYDQHSTITSVVFDASFADCTSLTSTAFWFYGCTALTTITDIENLKTDNVTSMRSMFNGCSSLTSLYVSGLNTDNVDNMQGLFNGCSSLESLDVSGFKTDNVTTMGGMFYNCSSLTSLDVSGFNTANVTNMTGMFYNCSSLTSLDVSGFKTDNVTLMEMTFANCSKLTQLDVSNFKTDKVTTMSGMFHWCNRLESIDVSGFNTENVTDMSYMFWDCYNLTNLDVSSFNTSNVTTMTWMFSGCNGLTSLDLTNFDTGNVIDMDYMFSGCNGLTSLDLSNFKTNKVTTMIGMFSSCYSLTDLDLSSFNTANVTNMRYMFNECRSLTSLDLSSFNTANVTNMSGMFNWCEKLTTIYASELWSTQSVTSGDGMFLFCMSLVGGQGTYCRYYDYEYTGYTYARIDGGSSAPGYFTNLADIMAKWEPYAVLSDYGELVTFYFDDKKEERKGLGVEQPTDSISGWSSWSLTTVVFDPSFAKCTSLTSTARWFYGCTRLNTLIGIENLKTDNVTDMSCMFVYCDSLQSLDLSSFNTANVTDMSYMFYGCGRLATIYVSEQWNTENVERGDDMFEYCWSLVGGQGTTYSWSRTDYTYARIDGGPSAPGYFTHKDATTTGLKYATSGGYPGKSANVYSLAGQQRSTPNRGINIINGRKVVVK